MKKFCLFVSILFMLAGGLFFNLDVFGATKADEIVEISSTTGFIQHFSNPAELSKSYKLTTDLDFSDESENLRQVYENWTTFTGSFDGDGHYIKNATIYSNSSNMGFFPKAQNATIQNFKLCGDIKFEITDATELLYVGTLVGQASGCTIKQCEIGQNDLVGQVQTYSNLYTKNDDGFAFETNSGISLGGVVGKLENGSKITDCITYLQGSFAIAQTGTLNSTCFGGIVGQVDNSQLLNDASYSRFTVQSAVSSLDVCAGGICGVATNNRSRIVNTIFGGEMASARNSELSLRAGAVVGDIKSQVDLIAFNYWTGDYSGYAQNYEGGAWDTHNQKVSSLGSTFFADNERWHDLDDRWDFDRVWNLRANTGLHLQVFQTFNFAALSNPEQDDFDVIEGVSFNNSDGIYKYASPVIITVDFRDENFGYYTLKDVYVSNKKITSLVDIQPTTEGSLVSGYTITLSASSLTEGDYSFEFEAVPFSCYAEVSQVEGESAPRGGLRYAGGVGAEQSLSLTLSKGMGQQSIEAVPSGIYDLDRWELYTYQGDKWVLDESYRATSYIVRFRFGQDEHFKQAFKLVAYFTDQKAMNIEFSYQNTYISQIKFNGEVYTGESPIRISPKATNVELEITVVPGYELNTSAFLRYMDNHYGGDSTNPLKGYNSFSNEDGSQTYRFSRISMVSIKKGAGDGNDFRFEFVTAVKTNDEQGDLLWLWITLPIVIVLAAAGGLVAFLLIRRQNMMRRLNEGEEGGSTHTAKKVKKTKTKDVDYKDYYS